MHELTQIKTFKDSSIYRIAGSSSINRYIASTPESREICNDPLIVGIDYTRKLETACCKILKMLKSTLSFEPRENKSNVFNILRGGLNFGLRKALSQAYGWNRHGSSFISAQRFQDPKNLATWTIGEDSYRKVYFHGPTTVFCGDVVASGSSLEHGLTVLLEMVLAQKASVTRLVFFTIGGARAEEVVANFDFKCRSLFSDFEDSMVIYLEGRFAVASDDSPLSIKLPGTDLLRRDSLLAREFIESQYRVPSYPLERCTIYDAGSRSFDTIEHLEDVADYWRQILRQSDNWIDFKSLLLERMPELEISRFGKVSLKELAKQRIKLIEKSLL